MAKKELPFDKYKTCLIPYLQHMGVDIQHPGLIRCFHPKHADNNPSCSVNETMFHCYVCGDKCSGDIYHAVEILTGETDRRKQFEEIDRIFGNGEAASLPAIPKTTFTQTEKKEFAPNPDALQKFTDFLKSTPHANDYILGWFAKRAAVSSGGKISQYPHDILKKLVTYFLWYQGKTAAINALGVPALLAAGLPYSKEDGKVKDYDSLTTFPPIGEEGKIYVALNTDSCYFWNGSEYEQYQKEPRKISWWSEGVVTKTPLGYKEFFYAYDKTKKKEVSKKYNPRSVPLLFADELKNYSEKTVIFVEGEMDAITCRASGIENIFATGGLGGLTKPKIKKYIIPSNIAEIILFADKDPADHTPPFQGQKKFGVMPPEPDDGIKETLPEQLIAEGFTGTIKVTVLPDDCPYKDPDEAILYGRLDLVQSAIANAQPYAAPEKPAKKTRSKKEKPIPQRKDFYAEWDFVPLKFFKSILRIFKYSEMKSEDVIPFMAAMSRSCNDEGATDALLSWCENSFTEDEFKAQVEKNETATPYYLKDTIFPRYNVSAYYVKRLEEYLIPAKEILNKHKVKKTLIPIDYEKIIDSDELQSFLDKKGNYTGADVLVRACDGNVIYLYEDKINYAYANGRWFAVPSLEFVAEAFNILQGIVLHYLEKYPSQKGQVNEVLTTLNTRRFRSELVNDFNGNPAVLCGKIVDKEVLFDSRELMGTTTLLDGVADFSGGELRFRKGKREEYRRAFLPYTVKEVREANEPKKFIKLMTANFRQADEETLKKNPTTTVETLMYYLSLIQSRDTSRRYGGFFLGAGGTGKTTLLKILDAVYPGLTTPLNSKLLVHRHTSGNDNPNGPTPETAKLEGKLLGYISETPENGKLDETEFKRLTGGDKLTARELHKDPHDFFQTAQIVIASNNSPAFSSTETATIDRMMIFRFNIKHEKGQADSKTPEQLIEYLRPEFPAIIKYLALKYIDLNINKKGVIPLSTECITEKGMYIDEQANDTDRFISNCLWFDTNSQDAFIPSKTLYKCYLQMLQVTYNKEFREDAKETPTQRQFTTWLKKHVEFQHSYGQKRVAESVFPEYGFYHIAFTEYGLALLKQAGVSTGSESQQSNAALDFAAPPPEYDPFTNATPPPPTTPEMSDGDGNDSNQYDIF